MTAQDIRAERALKSGSRRYKTALEWAMDQINDANVDIDVKSRLAIAVFPFQTPKIESVPADGGKKKQAADAAEEAQKVGAQFAAPLAPPRLVTVA